ncbi:MAG: GNAT family N-acetyltransferase [Bacteroidota bacterium]
MPYHITRLHPAELHEALEFYNFHYQSSRSPETFAAEFLRGPAGPAIYIIARHGEAGPIVGLHSAIPLWFSNSEGKDFLTGKLEDNLIHPEHRGKGLFELMHQQLLTACAEKGISALWALTYALKAFGAIGLVPVSRVKQGIYCISQTETIKALLALNAENSAMKRAKIAGLALAAKVSSLALYRAPSGIAPFTVEQDEAFDPGELINRSLKGGPYSWLRHDASALHWRMQTLTGNAVFKSYILRNADGMAMGYMVTEMHRGFAFIAEMYFDASLYSDWKKAFTRHVIEQLEKKGAGLIRFWAWQGGNNKMLSWQQQDLAALGFLFPNKGISFVWKTLQPIEINKSEADAQSKAGGEQVLLSRLYTQGG